jgi:hypothetical protein
MKELRFDIPEGYIVDFHNSDFASGYVKFRNPFDKKIVDSNISVRLFNGLKSYYSREFGIWDNLEFYEICISQLSRVSISKFAKCRNVGQKTVKELEEFCFTERIVLKP